MSNRIWPVSFKFHSALMCRQLLDKVLIAHFNTTMFSLVIPVDMKVATLKKDT